MTTSEIVEIVKRALVGLGPPKLPADSKLLPGFSKCEFFPAMGFLEDRIVISEYFRKTGNRGVLCSSVEFSPEECLAFDTSENLIEFLLERRSELVDLVT